jgi:ribonuclease HI
MKTVTLHTDGGCRGNPGPGAWAAVLRHGQHTREISGAENDTTNNRMELRAAIEGFTCLKEPCEVHCHTDSQYLRQGITDWIHGWKRNGWRTSTKQPVKNADLWKELDAAIARHKVHWHWVRGHTGNRGNERCDSLANDAMDRLQRAGRQGAQAPPIRRDVRKSPKLPSPAGIPPTPQPDSRTPAAGDPQPSPPPRSGMLRIQRPGGAS